ncbi:hypothetical protein D3C87_1903310 [compost metagenome]
MADADTVAPEFFAVLAGEMNAVAKPGARLQPMGLLQPVDRPIAEFLQAEGLFILGFGEMRVQTQIIFLRHGGTFPHQPQRHAHRRAGR